MSSCPISIIAKRAAIAYRLASRDPAKAWREAGHIIAQWGVHFDSPRSPDVHDMLRKLHQSVSMALAAGKAANIEDPVKEVSELVDIALASPIDPRIPIRMHGIMMFGFQRQIPPYLESKLAFCYLVHFLQLADEDKTFVAVATSCHIDFAVVLVRAGLGLDVLPHAIQHAASCMLVDDYFVATLLALIELSIESPWPDVDGSVLFDKADRIFAGMPMKSFR